MLLKGETEAVKDVLSFAETYGYGNMIAHLRRAWALKLMQTNKRLSYKKACEAANSSAYPKYFDIFKKAHGHKEMNKSDYPFDDKGNVTHA